MKRLDIIVPVLNEEESIHVFYNEVIKFFNNKDLRIELHFIFVDDGSNDETIKEIKTLSKLDNKVHFISFSRNFGKESAILAGLNKSDGDLLSIMDVDMQDPIEILLDMIKFLEEGYDCIFTVRKDRNGENILKSFFSRMFYFFCNILSIYKIRQGTRDFCMMKRHYKDALLLFREKKRFTKFFYSFLGFRTKYIEYNNRNRFLGQTKWNYLQLFSYAIDGIISESNFIYFFPFFMMGISFLIFLIIIFYSFAKYLHDKIINIFLIFFSFFFFLFGINFFILGIFGIYISRIFLEVKNRPNFIIKEEN